jgi:hypothetical protein
MAKRRRRAPPVPKQPLEPPEVRVAKFFDALVTNADELVEVWCTTPQPDARTVLGSFAERDLYELEAVFWAAWAHLEPRPNLDGDMLYMFDRESGPVSEFFRFDICKVGMSKEPLMGIQHSDVWLSDPMDVSRQKLIRHGLLHAEHMPRAELAFRVMDALYAASCALTVTAEDAERQDRLFATILLARARRETEDFANELARRLLRERYADYPQPRARAIPVSPVRETDGGDESECVP